MHFEHAQHRYKPSALTPTGAAISELLLHSRDGLPDALRVLLADYPRENWTNDPGFDALIKFWLDRHLMFRRILGELSQTTQGFLDRKANDQRFASTLSRHGSMLVQGLHEHHNIEDHHYFPKLVKHDPRLERGFEILDADHHALDTHLQSFVTTANDALNVLQDEAKLKEAAAQVLCAVTDLNTLLDRHLNDEEDLIVPVLLKFGSP